MSLATQIGREGNIFELSPENANQVMLNSPVLSQRKLRQLLTLPQFADTHRADRPVLPHRGRAGGGAARGSAREAEQARARRRRDACF